MIARRSFATVVHMGAGTGCSDLAVLIATVVHRISHCVCHSHFIGVGRSPSTEVAILSNKCGIAHSIRTYSDIPTLRGRNVVYLDRRYDLVLLWTLCKRLQRPRERMTPDIQDMLDAT